MRALLLALPLVAAFLLVPDADASPVGVCRIGDGTERCHLMIVCAWTEDGTEVCVPDVCGRIVCW